MAKKAPKEVASSYLDEILSKVPEDKRGTVKEALAADPILEDLGAHILRQEEFSRLSNEAAAEKRKAEEKYTANMSWWEQAQAELAAGNEAKSKLTKLEKQLAEGRTEAASTSGINLDEYVKRDEAIKTMRAELAARDQNFVAIVADMGKIVAQHSRDYPKDPLNIDDVVKLAQEKKVTLSQAYAEYSHDYRERKQEADQKAEAEALRKKIEAEVRAELSARGPYPMPDSSEGVSPLAGLKKGNGADAEYGVAAAVAAYNRGEVGR